MLWGEGKPCEEVPSVLADAAPLIGVLGLALALATLRLLALQRQLRRLRRQLGQLHVQARLARDRGDGTLPVRAIFAILDGRLP
jgi:hypothetical protein